MLTAVIIIFFIFFLLIIPVELTFRFCNSEKSKSGVRFRLFFGFLNFQVYPGKKKKEPEKLKPDEGKSRFNFEKILKLVTNDKFMSRFTIFLRKILKSLKLKLEKLYLHLGLDDPADTGLLWGILGPASAMFEYYSENKVIIEPEFNDSALDIDTAGSVTLIPLEILFISAAFMGSPVTIRTFWSNFVGDAK